jgi:hypothetical protein
MLTRKDPSMALLASLVEGMNKMSRCSGVRQSKVPPTWNSGVNHIHPFAAERIKIGMPTKIFIQRFQPTNQTSETL